MLFFKTSNAGVEDILTVRTDGFDCVLSSLLTATYYLKFFVLELEIITAAVVLTLSSHGGERLRPSQQTFFRNLSGC